MKDYNQVKSFNEISHWGIPNPDSPTESKILLSDELKDEAARSGMISSKLMDIDNYSIVNFYLFLNTKSLGFLTLIDFPLPDRLGLDIK